MSDFNELKRNNQSDDRVEAIYQKVDDQRKAARKRPTFFSTFLATIKRDKEFFDRSDLTENPPVLNASVLSILLLSAVALIILLFYFFVDQIILLPILLIYCPLATPILLFIFNFEMSRDRSISFLSVFVLIIIGLVFYLVLTLINSNVLYNISFYSNVEHYVYPVIFTVLLFFFTFIMASSFKVSKLSAYFLMAVTIALSYYYFYTMTRLFTDIFVNVKMDIGGQVYNFSGIFDDEQHVAMSIENIFDNWVYDFLFIPLMYSFWAIIIGSVVSVAAERRSQNRSLSRST